MIKNELEYNVTKSWTEKFVRALAALERDEEKKKSEPDIWQLHHNGVVSQLEEFEEQITEYEALVAHDPNQYVVFIVDDINQISDILIKARIALKITQKELAFLSDSTEEQIKSFEDKNYHNASFLNVLAVSDALGIKITNGRFVAKLDDFYKDQLTAMRQTKNEDAQVKAS